VSPEPLRPEAPSWLTESSGSADEGSLLQERLRLLGLVTTGIATVFYAVGLALWALGFENPLPPLGTRVSWRSSG
jgi:hypothetical protein